MKPFIKAPQSDYQLLDCGNYRRLERFGEYVINRPCLAAIWRPKLSPEIWNKADLVYKNGEWCGEKLPESWVIKIDKLQFELRLSKNGQVGMFPEQIPAWHWIDERIDFQDRPLKILNAFAYTGGSTLFGIKHNNKGEICHLDGAKASVEWAKKNASLNGFEKRNTRWIVDDVNKFIDREVKRKNTYDAIILDPPAFGRGAKSVWKLEKDLPLLLDKLNLLLSERPCFVVLSAHAPGLDSFDLQRMLQKHLTNFGKNKTEAVELKIPSNKGHGLPSSYSARMWK